MPANYKAKSEQAMLFSVAAWDANCPQHIPQRLEASDVATVLRSRDQIAELEAEIKRLQLQSALPCDGLDGTYWQLALCDWIIDECLLTNRVYMTGQGN